MHAFVLWSAARAAEPRILEDLQRRFAILEVTELAWRRARFAENLTCLYGSALPPGSDKERHCGTGPPLLVVVGDRDPVYGVRRTTRGFARVNLRTLAAKRRYRRWTGGGHRVHATLTEREAERDLFLLRGRRGAAYAGKCWDGTIPTLQADLTGAGGWEDLVQFATALEVSLPYVLLGDRAVLTGAGDEPQGIVVLAEERWEAAVLSRGTPVDGRDGLDLRRVRIDDRELVVLFLEPAGDPRRQALLDGRVRDGRGLYVPGTAAVTATAAAAVTATAAATATAPPATDAGTGRYVVLR